ncbi:MAG TPA: hypothetical protein VIY48_10325 [Candidatus Paceibacterota bacterium]
MPRVNWGVEASDVDSFDRESQYTPYSGPIPPNAVYQWKVKVAKFIAGTRDKFPQLRIGLELAPRAEYDEKRYKGYFIMAFIPVSDKTAFRYVPFLDALGVSGSDFTRKTLTDEEGNIKRIGAWKHDGNTLILAEKRDGQDGNGNSRPEVGWIGPVDESDVDTEDDEDFDVDMDEEEEYEEEAPRTQRNTTPPRRGTVAKTTRKPAARRSRRTDDEEDWS